MTPEERQRIEAIRDFFPLDDSWANAQLVWLLDLVERHREVMERLSEHLYINHFCDHGVEALAALADG